MSFIVPYTQVYIPYQRMQSSDEVFCSLEFDIARFLVTANQRFVRTQPLQWLFNLTYIDYLYAVEENQWCFFYNYYHLKDVFPDPETIDRTFPIQQYFADMLWLHNRQPNFTYLANLFGDFKTMDIRSFQKQYDYPVGWCETQLPSVATTA